MIKIFKEAKTNSNRIYRKIKKEKTGVRINMKQLLTLIFIFTLTFIYSQDLLDDASDDISEGVVVIKKGQPAPDNGFFVPSNTMKTIVKVKEKYISFKLMYYNDEIQIKGYKKFQVKLENQITLLNERIVLQDDRIKILTDFNNSYASDLKELNRYRLQAKILGVTTGIGWALAIAEIMGVATAGLLYYNLK